MSRNEEALGQGIRRKDSSSYRYCDLCGIVHGPYHSFGPSRTGAEEGRESEVDGGIHDNGTCQHDSIRADDLRMQGVPGVRPLDSDPASLCGGPPPDVPIPCSGVLPEDRASGRQHGGNHYKVLPIQPSHYIRANKLGWHEGNVVKYVSRHHLKNGAGDIRKAIHYLELILEEDYGNDGST